MLPPYRHEGSASGRISALPPLVFRVAALTDCVFVYYCRTYYKADSPVVWFHRCLFLNDNLIVSVAGVTWPANLRYVSPPLYSG
jgi:hypothetical protein